MSRLATAERGSALARPLGDCCPQSVPVNVLMVASVAVVVADPPQSRKLFVDALGLPLEGEGDGYYSSGSVEFEVPGVAAVAAAGGELERAGLRPPGDGAAGKLSIVDAKQEVAGDLAE
jgi:catechol 2,3-dioxygenase-like lactoylglutathione lyase family enzyme